MYIKKRHFFFVWIVIFSELQSWAQCAMCRAVLESEEGQKAAEGINNGIVYLMVIPYLLVGIIGYIVYKGYTKGKKPSDDVTLNKP